MAVAAPTLQQDAQIALAVLTQREDYVLSRIQVELDRTGHMDPHWEKPEHLGFETYALARRCRWRRADGRPDVDRARDVVEYLRNHRLIVTLQQSAYPVRSYVGTYEFARALGLVGKK